MDGRPPRLRLLHRRLGHLTDHLLEGLATPFVDPTHVRRRPRRPSVVPDAVGRLGHGIVGALGRLAARRRPRRPDPLALARDPRRHPGRRLRHDPPADADPLPRHLHLGLRAGAGVHRHHRRSRLRPRRHGSRPNLPEPGDKPARSEERVVLDRIVGADRRVRGLLPMVQERAVDEALSGYLDGDNMGQGRGPPWSTDSSRMLQIAFGTKLGQGGDGVIHMAEK